MKNIKKNIIKLLSSLVIGIGLFSNSISAYAYNAGWNVYNKLSDRTVWGYMYSDGTWATGWQYIDGKWYYFSADGIGYSGTAYRDANGNWCNITYSSFTIGGKDYFFDNNGTLITNTDVYMGSGHFKYHINENGHIENN